MDSHCLSARIKKAATNVERTPSSILNTANANAIKIPPAPILFRDGAMSTRTAVAAASINIYHFAARTNTSTICPADASVCLSYAARRRSRIRSAVSADVRPRSVLKGKAGAIPGALALERSVIHVPVTLRSTAIKL